MAFQIFPGVISFGIDYPGKNFILRQKREGKQGLHDD